MSQVASGKPSKVCVSCGEDVAKKPRTKDAEGNYYCEPCARKASDAAKAAQAAAAPAPTPAPTSGPIALASDEDMMRQLLTDAKPAGASPEVAGGMCPMCSSALAPGAIVCMICGYNAQTGRMMKTKMVKAPKEKSERKTPRFTVEIGGVGAFVISTAILGTLFALAMSDTKNELYVGLYALVFLVMGIVTLAMLIVTPFREGEIGWALVILLSPFVPFLGLAVLYYLFAVTDRGSLRGMYLATVVGYIFMLIIAYENGDIGRKRGMIDAPQETRYAYAAPAESGWDDVSRRALL